MPAKKKPPSQRNRVMSVPKSLSATAQNILASYGGPRTGRWSSKGLLGREVEDTTLTEVQIQQQVRALLQRLRHSVPCPADFKQVYLECVPPVIRDMAMEGIFELGAASKYGTTTENFVGMLNFGEHANYVRPERHSSGRYFAFSIEHYVVRGVHTANEAFWMNVPQRLPIMSSGNHATLIYPRNGAAAESLVKWMEKATRLDEEIESIYRSMRELASIMKTAAAVRALWPELLNFVRFSQEHTPPMDRNAVYKMKGHTQHILKDDFKDKVTSLLAGATLLPETEKVTAWVGFNP